MNKTFTLALLMMLFAMPEIAQAQQKPNEGIDNFYRGRSHEELAAELVSAGSSRFGTGSTFLSGQNGCPDEILIGSIQGGTDIFGSVDINVNLQNDIIINCGR